MPAYHPRSTRTQRPTEDRTVLLPTQGQPLRRLRRIGDIRPLPRVTVSDKGGASPTVIVPRRITVRNGWREGKKFRASSRACARFRSLLRVLFPKLILKSLFDFLSPALAATLGLLCLAAALGLYAMGSLNLGDSPSSPQIAPSASSWDPRTNDTRTSSRAVPVTPSSDVVSEPNVTPRQNVVVTSPDTSASPSEPAPTTAGLGFPLPPVGTPHPQSDWTSPPPPEASSPTNPSSPPPTPEASNTASPADTSTGSPSDGSSPGSSGTSSLSVGLSLSVVAPSPTD